jgi:hypothetical protein
LAKKKVPADSTDDTAQGPTDSKDSTISAIACLIFSSLVDTKDSQWESNLILNSDVIAIG